MTDDRGTRPWTQGRIRDLPIQFVDGDRSSKYPKRTEFVETGVPFLNAEAISSGYLDISKANFITEEKFSQIKKGRLEHGDLILTTRGNGVGKPAIFLSHDAALINAQLLILRPDPKQIEARYFFYMFCSPLMQGTLRNFVSGSAQPQLPIHSLREIEIGLPPLPTQRRIAGLLSAYDDLIENNTRRIAILEEMARRLYEEWFVRFRFPGHEGVKMVDSEVGARPKTWAEALIKEVCTRLQSGSTPARKNPDFWSPPEFDWFKTKELKDGYLFSSEEKISATALVSGGARMFEEGTILMAIYAAPTVGRLGVLTAPASTNQAALGFVADDEILEQVFLYYKLIELRDHFNNLAQGAAQQNISKAKVADTKIVVPDRTIQKAFMDIAKPMRTISRNLQQKNRNLRAQRDLLLPKLVSGEIDVSKTDEQMAEAAAE